MIFSFVAVVLFNGWSEFSTEVPSSFSAVVSRHRAERKSSRLNPPRKRSTEKASLSFEKAKSFEYPFPSIMSMREVVFQDKSIAECVVDDVTCYFVGCAMLSSVMRVSVLDVTVWRSNIPLMFPRGSFARGSSLHSRQHPCSVLQNRCSDPDRDDLL